MNIILDEKYFNRVGIIRADAPLEIKQQNFINKAKLKYGDLYDYSKVEYRSAKEKVILICKIHGEFLAIPNNHLNGQGGCQICGGNVKHSAGDFSRLLDEKFGVGILNSEKFKYVNYKTKGIICCTVCNTEFESTPNNLLSNNVGCPNCHKLDIANKKIYIARCTNIPNVFKLGISNNPKRRIGEVSKLSGTNLELVYETINLKSHTARDLESHIHKLLPHHIFDNNFNGCKEFIISNDITKVISVIEGEL